MRQRSQRTGLKPGKTTSRAEVSVHGAPALTTKPFNTTMND